ncbi:MAG: RNA polymerase sigma factor [Bdellovibrionota bacterium]
MDKEWSKIYQEHAPAVRAVLYKMGLKNELDDVVQECFVKAWKGLKNFRGDSSMKTWITRIAVNCAYDHFRRKGVNVETEEIDEEKLGAAEPDTKDTSAEEALRRALDCLSVPHREVLVLHVMEENSVDEVAAILKMSPGTVKSRLFHARANLHKILTKRGVTYE